MMKTGSNAYEEDGRESSVEFVHNASEGEEQYAFDSPVSDESVDFVITDETSGKRRPHSRSRSRKNPVPSLSSIPPPPRCLSARAQSRCSIPSPSVFSPTVPRHRVRGGIMQQEQEVLKPPKPSPPNAAPEPEPEPDPKSLATFVVNVRRSFSGYVWRPVLNSSRSTVERTLLNEVKAATGLSESLIRIVQLEPSATKLTAELALALDPSNPRSKVQRALDTFPFHGMSTLMKLYVEAADQQNKQPTEAPGLMQSPSAQQTKAASVRDESAEPEFVIEDDASDENIFQEVDSNGPEEERNGEPPKPHGAPSRKHARKSHKNKVSMKSNDVKRPAATARPMINGKPPVSGRLAANGKPPVSGRFAQNGKAPASGRLAAKGKAPASGRLAQNGKPPMSGRLATNGKAPAAATARSTMNGKPPVSGRFAAKGKAPASERPSTNGKQAAAEASPMQLRRFSYHERPILSSRRRMSVAENAGSKTQHALPTSSRQPCTSFLAQRDNPSSNKGAHNHKNKDKDDIIIIPANNNHSHLLVSPRGHGTPRSSSQPHSLLFSPPGGSGSPYALYSPRAAQGTQAAQAAHERSKNVRNIRSRPAPSRIAPASPRVMPTSPREDESATERAMPPQHTQRIPTPRTTREAQHAVPIFLVNGPNGRPRPAADTHAVSRRSRSGSHSPAHSQASPVVQSNNAMQWISPLSDLDNNPSQCD